MADDRPIVGRMTIQFLEVLAPFGQYRKGDTIRGAANTKPVTEGEHRDKVLAWCLPEEGGDTLYAVSVDPVEH